MHAKFRVSCFSHPDYTVGSGITPDQPLRRFWQRQLADYTAGEEFRLALKQITFFVIYYMPLKPICK